jgi:hypothetical protein
MRWRVKTVTDKIKKYRKCTNCKYCIEMDSGSSNYTTEGRYAYCLLGKNPNFPVDIFYEEAHELLYAEGCTRYETSRGIVRIDADRDEGELWNYSDDPEIIKLLHCWDDVSGAAKK